MAVEIAYELPYQDWGWKIGLYVALIGLASGAYLSGYVADVLSRNTSSPEHGQIAKYGYLAGLLGLAIGPPIMLTHLATPVRAMILPATMTNFDSWMTIGAYLLGGFAPGAALMFVWVAFGRNRPHRSTVADSGDRAVAADGGRDISSDGGTAEAATGGGTAGIRGVVNRIGLLDQLDTLADRTRPSEAIRLGLGGVFAIFAVGVLLYSAMALGSGSTSRVPLWDKTFLIPVQFLGGLGAGLFVAVALSAVESRQVGPTLQNYALAASGLLGASLLAIAATVVMLPDQSATAASSVDNLLSTYAVSFIGVALVCGIVVPIGLSIATVFGQRSDSLSPKAAVSALAAAGLLVVVGKVALAMSYLLAAEFTSMPVA